MFTLLNSTLQCTENKSFIAGMSVLGRIGEWLSVTLQVTKLSIKLVHTCRETITLVDLMEEGKQNKKALIIIPTHLTNDQSS